MAFKYRTDAHPRLLSSWFYATFIRSTGFTEQLLLVESWYCLFRTTVSPCSLHDFFYHSAACSTPVKSIACEGELIHTNTIEDFQRLDKKALVQRVAEQVDF